MTPDEPLMVAINSRMGFHPDEVSRHSFATARRGFDQDAVRQYLQALAAEIQEMLDREQALRRKVAEAERRAAEPELDEATLLRAVGVETAKILQTAHDAAQEVVARAESRAAEIVGEAESVLVGRQEAAEAEAAAVLEASQLEAEAVTESARQEAVALLQATKAECRRIVREAKGLRGEILADLTEKRRNLRVQLEELRAGRDLLIEVVDSVAVAVAGLRERVGNAEHDARLAAAAAGEAAEASSDDSDLEALLEADEGLLATGALGEEEVGEHDQDELALEEEGYGYEGASGLLEAPAGEGYEESSSEEEAAAEDHATSRRSVDELFARIRASREDEETEPVVEVEVTSETEPVGLAEEPGEAAVPPEQPAGLVAAESSEPLPDEGILGVYSAHEAAVQETDAEPPAEPEAEAEVAAAEEEAAELEEVAGDEPTEDERAIAERAEVLGPVTNKLSRLLKRALQDDQNVLLDAIRNSSGRPELESLLPAAAQRARLEEATAGLLAEAWVAGHRWLAAAEPADGAPAAAGRAVAAELAAEVSGLLRHRLGEAFAEVSDVSEGAAEAAGAAYREWRGRRVERAAGDFSVKSFSQGAIAGGAGTKARWVMDDDGQPCPDCDDNALAGPVPVGEEYPTGQLHPPVHPGCRCLLVPVSS